MTDKYPVSSHTEVQENRHIQAFTIFSPAEMKASKYLINTIKQRVKPEKYTRDCLIVFSLLNYIFWQDNEC